MTIDGIEIKGIRKDCEEAVIQRLGWSINVVEKFTKNSLKPHQKKKSEKFHMGVRGQKEGNNINLMIYYTVVLNVPGCGPTHKIHTCKHTHTHTYTQYTEQLKVTFSGEYYRNMKEETMNLLRKIYGTAVIKNVSDMVLCNFCEEFLKK